MIENLGKYYLYRHIRLDKDEPFYIGIGTKYEYLNPQKWNTEYKRAFDNDRRSDFWKRIVAKTHYKVEILLESNDYKFIKQKEIEFIALYGRKNLGIGPLTNLTDGGEGSTGRIVSEESIRKTTEAHSIKVLHKESGQEYASIKEASEAYNTDRRRTSALLKINHPKSVFQYVDESLVKPYINNYNKLIIQKSTGRYFHSANQLSKEYGFHKKQIDQLLANPESDFLCLNKTINPEILIDNRLAHVKHLNTGQIFNSVKSAWIHSGYKQGYDSFRSSTARTFNFPYALCDENGNVNKRQERLPKTAKQRESAASVWRGKKMPKELIDKSIEARSEKVININTGEIYRNVREAAETLNIGLTKLRHNLNWAYKDCPIKYQNEELNIKAQNKALDRANKQNRRIKKNIAGQSSQYIGVSLDKSRKKWNAQIRTPEGRKHLGRFNTEIEAAEAYQKALFELKARLQ